MFTLSLHRQIGRLGQSASSEKSEEGTIMEDMFETGLAKRKATLGDAYVERTLEAADDFTKPFQEEIGRAHV